MNPLSVPELITPKHGPNIFDAEPQNGFIVGSSATVKVILNRLCLNLKPEA